MLLRTGSTFATILTGTALFCVSRLFWIRPKLDFGFDSSSTSYRFSRKEQPPTHDDRNVVHESSKEPPTSKNPIIEDDGPGLSSETTRQTQQEDKWQQQQHDFNFSLWMRETNGGTNIPNLQLPANVHIVFFGDSITRFMYMAFRQWIHNGGRLVKDSDQPQVLNLKLRRWETREKLYSRHMIAGEQCDCFRPVEWVPDKITENRYYHNADRNITLTFVQKYGLLPAHGHWPPDQVNSNHSLLREYQPGVWEYNWSGTIRNHVARLTPKPDYIVFNAGIHKHDLNDERVRQDLLQSLRDTGITGIYKTTSWKRLKKHSGTQEHDVELCNLTRTMSPCLDLNWTYQVPSNQFWDHVHYKTGPNSRMIQQLMEILHHLQRGKE